MPAASEKGWYRSPVDKTELKKLLERSDSKAWQHITLRLALHILTAFVAWWSFGNEHYLLFAAVFPLHCVFLTFLGWAGIGHELSHHTVFKTTALNRFWLVVFSILAWKNITFFKASHSVHHRQTLRSGVDGEVTPAFRPSALGRAWSILFDFPEFKNTLKVLTQNSFGIVRGHWGNSLFPTSAIDKRKALVRDARIVLLGQLMLMILFASFDQYLLIFLVNLAPFFCTFPNKLLAASQHYGMDSDTADFRRVARTVLPGKFTEFLYGNMNYHIEHHMYPAVPFYNLPALRALIESDLPEVDTGLKAVFSAVYPGKTIQN